MTPDHQAQKAFGEYDLDGGIEIVRQLEGTHASFQVKINGRLYVLRQFNGYMDVEDLRVQFQLTELMRDAGLNTPVPVSTRTGEAFVRVEDRLWALFPWCDGHIGKSQSVEDLSILTSMQGVWLECCERIRPDPRWGGIVCAAEKFRQRKSWAWIVPLDQLPRFAREHEIIQRARSEVAAGDCREAFLKLLPEVDSGIHKFEELLKDQNIHELPHTVTHGDFWASNIIISDEEVNVLDLDCYSFEPRITDFARAANWYYRERTEPENAYLFKRFQDRARITSEEIEALLLMMCAHDLYYAVAHVLLFMEESPDDQDALEALIASIQSEMGAAERYQNERDRILRMFQR